MQKTHLTARYGAIQGTFWMIFAAFMSFASLFLLSCGFSNSAIGILIALSGILAALLQPWLAAYADRPDSLPLKAIVLAVAAAALACITLVLLLRSSRLAVGVFYCLGMTLLQLSTPLVNSLGVARCQGSRPNFGISRAVGSASYAVVAFILGQLTDRMGGGIVPWTILICTALYILSALCYPGTEKPETGSSARGGSAADFIRKYPRYCLVLIGCLLVLASHTVLNSFTYQILVTKGGGSREMGISAFLCAMIELPIMLGFRFLTKKTGVSFWFRICGVFFMAKALGTLLCSGMSSYYAVQLFQMGGWAVIAVSSVLYIDSIVEPEDAVKGQAFFTMAHTLGTVLGSIAGGGLIDAMGVSAALIFASAAGAAGAAIMLLFTSPARKAAYDK